MEKYKRGDIVGIERENERDENYKSTKNPQIDKSRTHLNYHTLPYEKKYLSFIDERIKKLAPKRKIRDDAVLITSFILGSDKEFFDGISPEAQKQFFDDCTEFFAERYGKENVVSAVVHLDESNAAFAFQPYARNRRQIVRERTFRPRRFKRIANEFLRSRRQEIRLKARKGRQHGEAFGYGRFQGEKDDGSRRRKNPRS